MQNIDEIYFEDFHETDVICVYSKCKNEHIAFLRNYLKDEDNRKVVFLEDDYSRYEDLKNFVDKNFASEKEKTKTVFIKDFENDLKKIAWKNVYLDLKIIKGSNETKNNNFEKISKTLTEFHLGANLT